MQLGEIEIDEIVAQNEVCALGKVVQLGQCRSQTTARYGEGQGLTGIGAYSSKGVDTAVLDPDFKVQREATG